MVEMAAGAALRWHASRRRDAPAITCAGTTITFGELERRTNRLARTFERRGVRPGDFVTIGLANGIPFYEATVAAWKVGATPQPISPRLPERERAEIIALAGSSLVVLEPIEPDADASDDPVLPDRVAPAFKAPTSGGSTGRPKLIVSGQAGVADPEAGAGVGNRRGGMAELVAGPLYHNAPFTFSASGLLHGNHLVVMPRFDASEALALIERHRVEWVMLVPTMMLRIWRLPEEERTGRDLSSVAGVLHVAAPCPAWLKRSWIDWLGAERIFELYAGTEAQGITVITGEGWLAHEGSVGRPRPGSMKVTDADGNDLAPGEVGEIWMLPREGVTTYRYIGAEPRVRDGWESIGDLGWMDDDGYLYLADRRTDLILAGGANISPAEVEAALMEHPRVQSCAVIGLPDDDLGQRVHAVLEVSGEVDDDELREFCSARLVRYKVPRTFERVDGAVRDDAGKVRRTELARVRAEADGGTP
jgi:bile acid-coenzyme A ligase